MCIPQEIVVKELGILNEKQLIRGGHQLRVVGMADVGQRTLRPLQRARDWVEFENGSRMGKQGG